MAPPADAPFVPPLLPATSQLGVPIYFTGEDFLKLTVKNAAAGVTVTLTGRTLAVGDLRPAPFTQTLVPATDRSDSTVTIPMPAGWLVNAQVIVSAGSPLTGQTWARLSVVHGNLSSAAELFTLASCYLTAKQPLSYPGTGVLNSLDGGGALRSITGSTPGAGANISETVPTGARWELLSFYFILTTSAAAGNRFLGLNIDDGANIYFTDSASLTQTASQANTYCFAEGGSKAPAPFGAFVVGNVPSGNRLGAGHRIRTIVGGLLAGDQFTAPQYLVREWIEGS